MFLRCCSAALTFYEHATRWSCDASNLIMTGLLFQQTHLYALVNNL